MNIVKSKFLVMLVAFLVTLLGIVFTNVQASTYLERLNSILESEFSGDEYLSREDFAVIISSLFFIQNNDGEELIFVDEGLVKPENKFYLKTLFENKILFGVLIDDALYMKPEMMITKKEVLTFLERILAQLPDEMNFTQAGFEFDNIVETFNLSSNMSVNEMAEVLLKVYDFYHLHVPQVTTYWGIDTKGASDGNRDTASFRMPFGVTLNNDGNLIIFDTYNNLIREVEDSTVNTLLEHVQDLNENRLPQGGFSDGIFGEAILNLPTSGVFNSKGDLFFIDRGNHAVRVLSGGRIRTFSGGEAGFADGTFSQAMFNHPTAIAIDAKDNLYIADTLNNAIRRISSGGIVTTIAGESGKEGYLDGLANDALFHGPSGIAVNSDGTVVYIADTGNHLIRKIQDGKVSTIAGHIQDIDEDGAPLGGFRNGSANDALFKFPIGITIAEDFIILADSGNNSIRAVTPAGEVITIAGNTEPGDNEGSIILAEFNTPMGVYYNSGNLYIADTYNNKIKKIQLSLI